MSWDPPSPRVAELIREGAARVRDIPDEWLSELDAVVLGVEGGEAIAQDPSLRAAVKRSNRANLTHWAEANVHAPGVPVPPNVGPEPIAIARDVVRRGLDDTALEPYRAGQNVAWRLWMQVCFELTSDPDELRELLDVTARSIAGFIDAQIAYLSKQMRLERDALTRGTHAERREVVALVIDGAPISRQRAATRLGYDLDRTHVAAVVWSEEAEPDPTALETAAQAVADAVGAARPLVVIAAAPTLWVWAAATATVDLPLLERALEPLAGLRVAIGPPAAGVDGFRRSHLDAIATQRLLDRLDSQLRLATYDAVELVALVTQDETRAHRFVRETLGALEDAAPELRETVRTYVAEQCNASRTAERLYTHRNSVLRRLARADELLPRPLAETTVQVAVALEVVRWRGT